jgi:hypothetical protein
MGFKVGEFAGKVAESDEAFFHVQMKPVSSYDQQFTNEQLEDLPVGQKQVDVEANYLKIQRESASIPQAVRWMQKEKESADLF